MGGVEYQVTKVDPTDPETKGMVYQVHKVSEEIAATLGGKVYRARIIKDPTEPTVAGKVYQIVLIDDPDDPSVKGKVYNAILTGGSEAVVVGPAVSPLALDDAIADTMEYVKAFGGTEQNGTPTPDAPVDIVSNNGVLKARHQSGLPLGYTLLEYIESTGTQYIISPVTSVQNGTFYLDFQMTEVSSSGFPTIWGAMPTGFDYKVVFGSGSQKLYSQPGNGAGHVNTVEKDTNRHQATITTTTDSETVVIDGQTFTNNFNITADNEMPLSFFARKCYDGMNNFAKLKLYRAWHKNANNVLDFGVVPVKDPNNVLGLYDMVSGVFYANEGTGDFVAGSTVSDPVEIYADGTVETIVANSKNYLTRDGETTGQIINPDGTVSSNSNYCISAPFTLLAGDYTCTWTAASSGNRPFSVYKCDANGDIILTADGGRVFYQGFSATGVNTGNFTLDSTTLVRSSYRNNMTSLAIFSTSGTATAEMLLKVDSYQDIQSILDGVITRKCGTVVLDSSFEWTYDSTYGRVNATIPNLWGSTVARTVPGLCTHFKWLSHQESISSITAGQCYSAGANRIFLHISQTSAAAFAAWLDAQRDAGTPVVIVFPLENATTESVAGQTLQVTDGDNVLEITQASIGGLQLEAEYEKEA